MRKISRYALALFVTPAWGLARPVAAQEPAPVVSHFTAAAPAGSESDALALPRVAPPRPSPTSPIMTVSTTSPKPAVDLLAAPTVPPAWLEAPAKVAVIASGLPAQAPEKLSAPVRVVAAPKIDPTPLAVASVIPAVSGSRPTLQPLTGTPRLARCWPPAHLVARKNVQDVHTPEATYIDAAPRLQTPAVVPASVGNSR